MEKIRTLTARKYLIMSCHLSHYFAGHKKYEEALILTLTNKGGSINFLFTNLNSGETTSLDNPPSGEYVIPLKKGEKTKLLITASKAIGAYKIAKKTILDP